MDDSQLMDSLLEGSPLECSICLERMQDVSYLITQPDVNGNVCTHYFCTKCIQPLVKIAKDKGKDPCCPSCRRLILAVTKSRICDELIKEASHEREQRKDLQQQIEELEKVVADAKNHKEELKELKKSLKNKEKQQKAELNKLVQEKENLQKELQSVKQKMDQESQKWTSTIKQLNEKVLQLSESNQKETQNNRQLIEKSAMLQNQLDISQSSLQTEKKRIQDTLRELEDLKKDSASYIEEIDKWKKLYQHAVDDLQRKSKADVVPKKQSLEKSGDGGLSSWFAPLTAVSVSNPLTYLFGTRSGPLVKSNTDYKFLERRGSTLNSAVWKATIKSSPHKKTIEKPVALKRIKQNASIQDTWREAMLLGKLEHNNILKLQGILRDCPISGTDISGDFLVLPFVELDLEYVLSHRSTQLKESQTRFIVYQMASAIYYLHSADIVHREIRPTAILLDEGCNVKLGSFSNAQSLHSQPFNVMSITSYSAPENIYMPENRPADWWKSGDIWSFGCVFIQMLTGNPLFEAKDKNTLLSQIFGITECKPSASDFQRFPILNTVEGCLSLPLSTKMTGINVPSTAKQLLENMLSFDPVKRISAEDILQHKYFDGASYLMSVHRTCPLANDATDDYVQPYLTDYCGGL